MLDDTGFAGLGHVNDCERGIADFAHTADGQRIHDDLGRTANVHGASCILQSHGGGHTGQHAGLHSAAQAIREHADDAALRLDLL